MPVQDLKSQIARLPEQPGVYLYFNSEGESIYVGKARSLRDRVRSYLGAAGANPKTDALLEEAARLEVIVTDSVVEALALENHLIKQRTPKYNILLRDDKNYPYLQLTTTEDFPRVLVARRVERDGNFYAGPFLPASLARKTMGLTHRLFGMRSCNEVITGQRGRPCLEYDIGRCVAPCVEGLCSAEEYAVAVQNTQLFLAGRTEELLTDLTSRMKEASATERFEQAAHLRDAIRTVQTLQDRQQKIATARLGDRDAFGLKVGPAGAVLQVFQMRRGRVIERIELTTETAAATSDAEILLASVQQFYEDRDVPPEIHLPLAPDALELEVLEDWLSLKAGQKVTVSAPKRGDRRGLVELANRNAALAYDGRFNEPTVANYEALETLRHVLSLPGIPRRIECFDISTIQGSETVASMVVCESGRMKKGEYRKFRIKGIARGSDERAAGLSSSTTEVTGNTETIPKQELNSGSAASVVDTSAGRPIKSDDFAAMYEVVLRRYRKILEHGGPFPDLILIDGGKGQLSSAYQALEALGLANLVAVGLAKKEELIFARQSLSPIALPTDSPGLLLLQRIRDEAHRFAVTFHRRARAMRDLHSELDGIAGVGPRRRTALLRRFGSLAGVRRATREELTSVVGPRAADRVLSYFAHSKQ
ncbi:MAG TPA: excinuclease ABC subunit UvrC [Vicinamibacterales bacterium]|jgi:excinuclease ABC subunit C